MAHRDGQPCSGLRLEAGHTDTDKQAGTALRALLTGLSRPGAGTGAGQAGKCGFVAFGRESFQNIVMVIDSHFLLSWKSKVRSGLGGPGVCESEGGRHKQGHGPCSVPFRTTEQGSVGAPARPGALQPR